MKKLIAPLLLLALVIAGVLSAANVVTDGTMETNPTVTWTHVNVSGTNAATKDTAQKGSGTSSLKIASQVGKSKAYEWYDWQTVGSIQAGSTVNLSLWYGTQSGGANAGTASTLTAEISTDGVSWSPIWTKSVTPTTTFASGTQAATDVSSSFVTTATYRLRLRAQVNTPNNSSGQISVWWDDVVLDVTPPAPIATTIGDGAVIADVARVCPGDGAQVIDAFTLTSSRNSSVSQVSVQLATGTAESLSLVEVTNDNGQQVLGSISNPPSDSITIGFPVTSTITTTQYKIRVTPKSAVNMPARPGSAYSVTARVTGITSDAATVTNNDTAQTHVNIDNLSPANANAGASSAGDGFVDIAWTNPADSDFAQVVVARANAPITDLPTEGMSYSMPGSVGTTPIVAIGTSTSLHDTTVANGSTYYYKIFAKDSCGNYAAGTQIGPLQPQATPHLTTVGNGSSEPTPPPPLCPGDGAAMLDAFTLTTAVRTDTISAVEVTFASGTAAALSNVEITSDDGTQVYGSLPNPPGDVVTVPLSTNLIATTSTTQYKIRVTPRPHTTMPANVASPYSVAGRVTAVTSADPKDYRDSGSGTITIDNAAPSAPVWGSGTPGDAQVALSWSNPSSDFGGVVIVRFAGTTASGSATDGNIYQLNDPIGSGRVVYSGSASSFADQGLTNGQAYTWRIFAFDGCRNYSAGANSATFTPSSVIPQLTIGSGVATVDSCTQITVRAPFMGDTPSNSTTLFERSTASGGPWTTACANVTGSSPRVCVMSGLTAATTYYIRVTHSDPDGTTGQNPQLVGPATTPAVCLDATTVAGTATARVNGCNQITVTAPFANDGNGNGAVKVEFNTTNSWPGTTACASVTGGTPRVCSVSQLSASTPYWLRVTYSDPDGLAGGTAVQTLGPLTTSACGGDSIPPLVAFLSPARDAIIGGNERFKVQVYDAGGLAATNPVQWSVDGGAWSTNVSVNSRYACGTGCAVYEFTLATDALANAPHFVTVQATDAAGNVANPSQSISVSNRFSLPFGSGTILRRTHSAQLCMDCHALPLHSSQASGTGKFGTWSIDCVTCHTPHGTSNIGLIRQSIRTPNSGAMAVDFRAVDRTSNTNPQYGHLGAYDGSGAPFNDGVCEVCHTKTDHYRNDSSGGDHTHNAALRCTSCHSHTSGFKGAGCNACHTSPPNAGKHRTKHDEVWDSTDANTAASYSDTSSHATATQYGFACAKCHSGTHRNDSAHNGTSASPWQAEVVFEGVNAGGNYAGTYNQFSEKPLNDTFSWSNGTCSNTYCHSNANPRGGTNSSVPVSWNGVPTTCTSCHKTGGFGDGANDATYLSKSHAMHIKSSATETNTYAFKCDACHSAVIKAAPHDPWLLDSTDLANKALHVNETNDVDFYDRSVQTCGGTYCHSPGTKTSNFDPPNVALKWGQSGTCRSCHSGNATAAPTMATGKHAQHVNIASTMGTNVGCVACHAATVSDDNTISAAGYANHVNGQKDVSGTYAGSYLNQSCASSRCHSSGVRAGTIEYYPMSWTTGPAITDCKGCHGRHSDNAFVSVAGEPNYTNAPASSKYNSHHAHVASASDCHACHASTVGTANKIDGTNPAKHMDFDGVPDVTFANGGTYDPSSRTCSGVSCHGSGTPQWGGASLVCGDCHFGASDSDNWSINDNVLSKINSSEWTSTGHGQASIALPGANPCLYCHSSAVAHKDATNPFRLANYGATGDGVNSVCLVCHKSGSSGYNPGSGLKNGTKKIDAVHYGTKHSSSANGGQRCWDCHDPHGDGNIKMIGKTQVITATDAWGINATRTTITTSFLAMTTGSDFAKTSSPYNGICNVCHATAGHYTATSGDSAHYQTQLCLDCHAHSQPPNSAFRPGGGDCLNCHGTKTQGSTPARRAVQADFSLNSHHVGTGGTMGGTLTNFDCVICHAEGNVVGGKTVDTSLHMNGTIELRNADNNTAYFVYDKDAISGASTTWNSSNAAWRTQTSTALDPFCLSCHDANGASTAYALGDTGATAQNPFKDTAITNNYDQLTRPAITDIKSKVTGAPPSQGTFARHAIRGQSASIYTKYQALGGTYKSVYEFGGFTSMGTDESGKPLWNDTSVMGCADCHTTDGANGASGNAHGANSEYLLKDSTGGATKGTGTTTASTYVCVRCHASSKYADSAGHTGSSSDWLDSVGQIGSLRTLSSRGAATDAPVFGMACTNCHGGAPGINDGTNGFGWIHGTNQVFRTGASGGTGTRNAYRFMNGGGLRYYIPGSTNWDTTAGTCYTLASAETWSSCTQHGGTSKPLTKGFARPLNY